VTDVGVSADLSKLRVRTVEIRDDEVVLIDQRVLPHEERYVHCRTWREVAEAIRDMTVRGAPAIGVAAAGGLTATRPTAVNLAWAVDHMLETARDARLASAEAVRAALLAEAQRMADEDVATNKRLAAHGAALLKDGDTVLHHCNTGMLATVDYGTALGVVRMAHEQGKHIHVLLDETRPRLQGARLSAWECEQLGIPYDILPDTAAGYFMRRGEVSIVLFGADRVAANGDVVNKVGSYQIAVLARENGIPCYSVFPISTVDLSTPTGDDVPIEERDLAEVRAPYGCELVPAHYRARNPAFDVTPHR